MTFPDDAMAFYAELRLDNTREFWQANKARYEAQVRAPVEAIAAGLADKFGAAKVYRPHRDLRFSADKTPYKTHQGAQVSTGPACGWYFEVNADDFVAGGGWYHAEPQTLAAYRAAVDDELTGTRLARIVAGLEKSGWQVLGDQLKTAPRGYPVDHPRIRLLRHKSLYLLHEVSPESAGTQQATAEIAGLWDAVAPLLRWFEPVLRAA